MSDSSPISSRTPDVSRRTLEIAHVLFTDIVAYSKLPMDKQEQLLMRLQNAVRQTPEFARAEASEELIRLPTGDGMALVFFRDAEAPVRCALELSRSLHDHPDLELRMGIHSGPVYRVADINANRNVAGGGINLAQRVMDCGDAGHILVSREVAEVLGQLSSWRPMLHDLGEVEVKHGVRIHIYNLYTDGAGNPELPKKITNQRETLSSSVSSTKKRKRTFAILVVTIVLAITSVSGWLFYPRKAHALTDKDTVVLADFTNTTGDAVFDGTLRQGLSVQLEQSPFLSIISDQQIQQTLKMMDQKPEAKLTPEIARELCQRTASAAVLDGSIAQIGTQYLLTLKAVNCASGESLASTVSQAIDKNHVLEVLGKTASDMRYKLGESLSTVQKFDTPLEQATTPSLEALKAFSLGRKLQMTEGDAAAIAFFRRAIELDQNFALAYAHLGIASRAMGDPFIDTYTEKAYELRDRVSEPEKYYILAAYFKEVTGNMEKAEQSCKLWMQAFPRSEDPHIYLSGTVYPIVGKYEKATEEANEAIRLKPDTPISYAFLMSNSITMNRLDEAEAAYKRALFRKLDSPYYIPALYQIAFLQDDAAGMAQQIAKSTGVRGVENQLLALEADTAAYYGRLRDARALSRRAIDSARLTQESEASATYAVISALREAMFGNVDQLAMSNPSSPIRAVFAHSFRRDVIYGLALAFAYAGDDDWTGGFTFGGGFPEDTIVQSNYVPTIRAKVALNKGNASEAIEILRAATPYELGMPTSSTYGWNALCPVYVRGEAYLAAHRGREAAAEFQKIIDCRGIVLNEPIAALARLQIGRAYVLEGNTVKAKAAYQDFLMLWKDADPDIPILIAAKSEYAKLH
jgi:class 3 adenylate cyclase/tetratricopeptide (TPR) repeat protein